MILVAAINKVWPITSIMFILVHACPAELNSGNDFYFIKSCHSLSSDHCTCTFESYHKYVPNLNYYFSGAVCASVRLSVFLQKCKFGEQISRILEFKPEGLEGYLNYYLSGAVCAVCVRVRLSASAKNFSCYTVSVNRHLEF